MRPSASSASSSVVISHREMFDQISIAATPSSAPSGVPSQFNNESHRVTPTNPNMFPWLSTFASSFTTYRFRSLRIMFRSLTSSMTSQLILGTVGLVVNYDVREPPFQSLLVASNYAGCRTGVGNRNLYLSVANSSRVLPDTHRYIRPYSLAEVSDGDARLDDLGLFQVFTAGFPTVSTNTVIGQLWVEYVVELRQPQFIRPPVDCFLSQSYTASASTVAAGFVAQTTDLFGAATRNGFQPVTSLLSPMSDLLYYQGGNVNVMLGNALMGKANNILFLDSTLAGRVIQVDVMLQGLPVTWYDNNYIPLGVTTNNCYLGVGSSAFMPGCTSVMSNFTSAGVAPTASTGLHFTMIVFIPPIGWASNSFVLTEESMRAGLVGLAIGAKYYCTTLAGHPVGVQCTITELDDASVDSPITFPVPAPTFSRPGVDGLSVVYGPDLVLTPWTAELEAAFPLS